MNVAIILTHDFSERLEKLAFHTPVWMIETPENRAAAEKAWLRAVEWPHIDVTLFRSPEWSMLLAQIELHHDVDSLDVVGAPLTDVARNALAAAGFPRVDATADGFRARKP